MVITPKAPKEAMDKVIEKLKEVIIANEGKIKELKIMGLKRLAYPVNDEKEGVYLLFQFDAPAKIIKKLREMIRVEEIVMKILIIKHDDKVKTKEIAPATEVNQEQIPEKEDEDKEIIKEEKAGGEL